MAIQVSNAEEFKRLIVALALEMVDAKIAFKMHMNLVEAHQAEIGEGMSEAWTFWSLTIQGHLDSAVFRLCRIYDQDDRNLGLRGFLDTVRANQHLFSIERFAERVQGRVHQEDLASSFEVLDPKRLETDMDYVTRATNPTVDRLIMVRHNYYSHRNARDVVADRAVHEAYPHMRNEVGELLDGGLDIVNYYSGLFDMNTWSSVILGATDFHYVLKAVRERLQQHRAERGI